MQSLLLLAFLAIQANEDAEVARGRLCVTTPSQRVEMARCELVEGTVHSIQEATEQQRFFWLSEDGRTLVMDGVGEGQSEIALRSDERHRVGLEVAGSPSHGWPSDLSLKLEQKNEPSWRLNLPGDRIEALRELWLTEGDWQIELRAAGHQPRTARFDPASKDAPQLRLILAPLPRLTGFVTDGSGDPITNAALVDANGETLAMLSPLGRIDFVPDCPDTDASCTLPVKVSIEAPGLAPYRASIRRTDVDFDLGRLVMGPGGAVVVRLRWVDQDPVPVIVEVTDDAGNTDQPASLGKGPIGPEESSIRFDRLPAGRVGVTVRGNERGRVVSDYVDVKDGGESELLLEIRPIELRVRVMRGETPLEGAEIEVAVPHGKPDHDFSAGTTDGKGLLVTTVWDEREMVVSAARDGLLENSFIRSKGEAAIDVFIRFSINVIHGHVYDAETGEPFQDVRIGYVRSVGQSKLHTSVVTDADGRFDVRNAPPGTYEFRWTHPDYLPGEATIVTTVADLEASVELPMRKGEETRVRLRWPDGSPIANAHLREDSGARRWSSDQSGLVSLFLDKGAVADVWIVPREESFGFATITQGAGERTIVLPRGGDSIAVRTIRADGTPAPRSYLGLSFEGRIVPRTVVSVVEYLRGFSLRTGPDATTRLTNMPPGTYEMWATEYTGDDLWVGPPSKDHPIARFYYGGGQHGVTIEAKLLSRTSFQRDSANSSIIASLNFGMSSGLRLLTILPSRLISSSTQ